MMNFNYEAYGQVVRKIRKSKKISMLDVCEQTGISYETLRRIEKGEPEPKISTLERLSILYKIDLIDLLTRYRRDNSLFSTKLSHEVAHHLNNMNLEALRQFLEVAINELVNEADQEENKEFYTQFLWACKSIEFSKSRNLQGNITNIEKILLIMSDHRKRDQEPFYYPFEVTLRLVLAVQYLQNNNHQEAIKLLSNLLEKLLAYPFYNDTIIDQIGAVYLNLASVYMAIDQCQKTVEIINLALNNPKLSFTKYLYNGLILRLAIATFKLHPEDDLHTHLVTTVLMTEEGLRRTNIIQSLRDYYHMVHPLFDE